MKLRHKTPSFVSMWMLDVFCCALGCVTLLWLLKTREAGQSFADANLIKTELLGTKNQLLESGNRELELSRALEEKAKTLLRVESERDKKAKNLALVIEQSDELRKRLALLDEELTKEKKNLKLAMEALNRKSVQLSDLEKKSIKISSEILKNTSALTEKNHTIAELTKSSEQNKKQIDELETLVRSKESARLELSKRLLAVTEKLNAIKQSLPDVKRQQDALSLNSKRLTELEAKLNQSQKDLKEANATIIDLQGNKAKLADKLDQLRNQSDNLFAGIALTGKKAIFLVDMSGSMDLIDEKTRDPQKWPTVRDTVLRVMRSLPNLEKYQVILFSNRLIYLSDETGSWLDYHGEKSIEFVNTNLSKIKPSGDTNMYIALEECFKYRAKGLDTIYLFSDGLPNSGPGLSDQTNPSLLKETERSELLGRYIRRMLASTWNKKTIDTEKVRINSIGFFYESPDVGAFLWALSRENNGSFVGMSKP